MRRGAILTRKLSRYPITIGEELVIAYGRIVRRIVDDRTAGALPPTDLADDALRERFDPRRGATEWRNAALHLIDNWARRLRAAGERGMPALPP